LDENKGIDSYDSEYGTSECTYLNQCRQNEKPDDSRVENSSTSNFLNTCQDESKILDQKSWSITKNSISYSKSTSNQRESNKCNQSDCSSSKEISIPEEEKKTNTFRLVDSSSLQDDFEGDQIFINLNHNHTEIHQKSQEERISNEESEEKKDK
jgi:hypothetical protein